MVRCRQGSLTWLPLGVPAGIVMGMVKSKVMTSQSLLHLLPVSVLVTRKMQQLK